MTVQLVEVAVTRTLFAAILARNARLAIPPPVVVGRIPAQERRNAGKTLDSGESPRATSAAVPKTTLGGMIPAERTTEPEPSGKKWRKLHCVLDAGRRGALLQSWLLRAWIGSRLSPPGKCRLRDPSSDQRGRETGPPVPACEEPPAATSGRGLM